jgi:hypothetical protein
MIYSCTGELQLIRRERADPISSVSGQIGKIKGVERDLSLISLTFLLSDLSPSSLLLKEGLGIARSRGSYRYSRIRNRERSLA